MTADNLDTVSTPGLARRLAAMFYDGLLVFAICFCVTLAVVGLRNVAGGEAIHPGERAIAGGFQLVLQVALCISVALFFGWFWTRTGQTLGMQTWRLRIDNLQGGRISWQQAMIRLLVACLSISCAGLGYWWVLFDRDKRSWHDIASQSSVRLLPKPEKQSTLKKQSKPKKI